MSEKKLPALHLACIEDELRPNFSLIKIDNYIASATNGTILVKIDLRITTGIEHEILKIMNGKYIHCNAWKEFFKCDEIEILEDQIHCYKNGIKKTFYYSNPVGEFFKFDNIIIDIKESGEDEKRYRIYSPRLISTIHKIFECDSLTFCFSKEFKGDVVFPSEGCGMFAVLMPQFTERPPNRYFFI